MAQRSRTRAVKPAPPDVPVPPAGEARTVKSDSEERHRRISDAAYYRAQRRGFEAGKDWEDWFEAERQIDGI
ncbi:MAG TPA: DUF2934 domain-containing protein [Burkholderiales bacterium]|nr:DUF2934 domain-containing protein [Burkholderiales bacterium]